MVTRILVLSALFAASTALAAGRTPIVGTPRVADGDSLDFKPRQVRLWGIDAPELAQTCRRGAQRWDCGRDAKAALAAHLRGSRVQCSVVDIDKHDRAVSRCTVRGRSVNEWMVRQGWALDYRRYSGGAFAAAEAEARAAKRGIWSGTFENPERFRRR